MNVLRDGLTWLDGWIGETESVYSIVGKLIFCNPMRLQEFGTAVFASPSAVWYPHQTRARSMLFTEWADEFQGTSLANVIYQAGIQRRFSNFGHLVSSDEALRYCPSCIACGFHSALCQVDAVILCPSHGCHLLSSCRWCGSPTSPMKFTPEVVSNPFSCLACRQFLGDGGMTPMRSWNDQDCRSGWNLLASRLSHARHVECLVSSPWEIGATVPPPSNEERILAFATALRLLSVSHNALFHQATCAIECERIDWKRESGPKTRPPRIGRIPDLTLWWPIYYSFQAFRKECESAWGVHGDSSHALTVQAAARRLNTNPSLLGLAAALERLDGYLKRVNSRRIVNQDKCGRPFTDDRLDSGGWEILFQYVLNEEVSKATQWKAALQSTEKGCDRWHRLISTYAQPYRAGRLGAFVFCLRSQDPDSADPISIARLGSAMGSDADWYGFRH